MSARGNQSQLAEPGQTRTLARNLERIGLFATLPSATIASIQRIGRTRQFDEGAFLFFEGEPASRAHFLLDGQVKIVRETEDGQEVIIRLIQPGEFFGGAGGWGTPTYPATAVALATTQVFQLPATDFANLIDSHSDLAAAVIRELGARLREAEARIRELQAERVERRIARTLLRLAGKAGHKTNQGIQIDLPRSRQHLAELSGATLTTVSRVLSAWDRQGLIIAGRERVIILQPHELVTIAEDIATAEIG